MQFKFRITQYQQQNSPIDIYRIIVADDKFQAFNKVRDMYPQDSGYTHSLIEFP